MIPSKIKAEEAEGAGSKATAEGLVEAEEVGTKATAEGVVEAAIAGLAEGVVKAAGVAAGR